MILLPEIAAIWGPAKSAFEKSVGLSADVIHIHVGVALLLFFAWVTRRPLHDWRPWLLVLLVEAGNEIIDMNQKYGTVENNWPASRHDLLNTMFVPSLLLLYYAGLRWRERSEAARRAAQIPAE